MNKIHFYIIAFIWSCLTLTACSNDAETPTDPIAPTAVGTYTDPRDGETYNWVRYGNLEWMADNFRYNINDNQLTCRLYAADDKAVDVNKYGRLYTHTGAVNACPDGWRLPTDEDWKNLEMQLGMSASDANKMDYRSNIAYRMLAEYDNQPAINLILGGYYTPNMTMGMTGYRFLGAKAYYWTASNDADKGETFFIFRELIANNTSVRRQSTADSFFMSVRYVRDVQN